MVPVEGRSAKVRTVDPPCQPCSHGVTESPSYTCHHCLKAKGSSIEPLRSEAHGEETCRYQDGTRKGVCEERPLASDEDNKNTLPPPASSEGDKPHPGGQQTQQKDSPRRSSASTMRAAFARRRLDASASTCHVSISTFSPLTVQCHTRLPQRDRPSAARQSLDEVGLTHIPPHPTRPRGAHNLLSHLPLHSQQPSRTPSPLIPIGGIHMIQPRSTLPLYSLVSRPTTGGPLTSWRLGDAAPKAGFPLLQRQETLEETPRDPEVLVGVHRDTRGGLQQPSSPGEEARHPDVDTERQAVLKKT
ncbi:hypothetical protein PBY51_005568 [Eleginops maclovinus]|uniref:Uncharacterized protein n=1 Tax=Eleginops maclovinus TaxID=56733 RepID=A0AAN7X5T1_ELEMC|nr:hypothetical protein PBY51_005568 [Eleginops maclovinus]